MKASMYQTNPNKEDQVKYVIVIVKGSEQPQTTEECGSIGHGPLTRPSATLSQWERHGSFEKAPWVRGRQLNKFDRNVNFVAT